MQPSSDVALLCRVSLCAQASREDGGARKTGSLLPIEPLNPLCRGQFAVTTHQYEVLSSPPRLRFLPLRMRETLLCEMSGAQGFLPPRAMAMALHASMWSSLPYEAASLPVRMHVVLHDENKPLSNPHKAHVEVKWREIASTLEGGVKTDRVMR